MFVLPFLRCWTPCFCQCIGVSRRLSTNLLPLVAPNLNTQSLVDWRYRSSPWRGLVFVWGRIFSITLAATTNSCAGRREVNNHPPFPKLPKHGPGGFRVLSLFIQDGRKGTLSSIACSSCLSAAQSAYKHGMHVHGAARAPTA